MPWKRPSSKPTSWACAIRSSASEGVLSSVNGSESRSSSSTSSGARPASSSLIEAWWISLSRLRLASSSGAAFTSSSSCRIMLPIRITLAGCSTSSVIERSSSSPPSGSPTVSAEAGTEPMGCPSGPITTTCCSCSSDCPDCSLMSPTLTSDGEKDLPGVPAALHQAVRRGDLLEGKRVVHHRPDLPVGDQGPHVLDDRCADGGLLLDRAWSQQP